MRSRMIQSLKTAGKAARLLVAAFAAGCLVLVTVIPAGAQQRYERRTLMDLLFGRQAPPERQPRYDEYPHHPAASLGRRKGPQRQSRKQRPQSPTHRSRPPSSTPQRPCSWSATFLPRASATAYGTHFPPPGVAIQTRGNIASGLVRTDYYDWQAQLPKMLDALKPAVVVVTIGANDRQQMIAPGLNEKFGSDTWLLAYEERVQALQSSLPRGISRSSGLACHLLVPTT